jgi:hypothetical protein
MNSETKTKFELKISSQVKEVEVKQEQVEVKVEKSINLAKLRNTFKLSWGKSTNCTLHPSSAPKVKTLLGPAIGFLSEDDVWSATISAMRKCGLDLSAPLFQQCDALPE